MMFDRTAENCEAVKRFLAEQLGGEVSASDLGDHSGVYFHSNQSGVGRLTLISPGLLGTAIRELAEAWAMVCVRPLNQLSD